MTSIDLARMVLAEALNLPAASIPEDARIGGLEAWDSLAHLRLILAIEAKRGAPLDPHAAASVECLADVARVIAA
jgi:acyl carrier protein